jgi:hypothetical protein
MPTLADLFTTCYPTGGSGVEFSAIRLHYRGVDEICRAFGACALTVGSDIYSARRRSRRARPRACGSWRTRSRTWYRSVAEPSPCRKPRAASPWPRPDRRRSARQTRPRTPCSSSSAGTPRHVDEERLQAEHPGAQTLCLPGSGLVVTLGELNVLPDYLAHPAEIENAPEAFLLPLIQSVRSLNIAELRRLAGSGFRPARVPRLPGSLKYPRLRQLAEIGEVLEVDALGRRCGLAPWKLYSSAVGRNAGHFAPFSWYRWRSYHLMART